MKYIVTLLLLLLIVHTSFAQEGLYTKIKRMVDSVSTGNLATHIKTLEYAGGHESRVNFTPGNDSAAVYIYNTMKNISGLTSVEADTFFAAAADTPFNAKPLYNIVATIKGTDTTGYYVLGAHFDCSASRMGSSVWNAQWQTIKAPGADDNATGVASLFEVARILSDTANHFIPQHTIKLVAFAAEETGPAYEGHHLGSLHFAEQASLNSENILGAISLDMVGYNDNYNYTAVVSNTTSQWLGGKITAANNLFNLALKTNSSPFPYATYSDHASFWDYNYAAILLIENAPPWNNGSFYQANPYYHTSADSFGTLNMELVTKMAQLSLSTMAALSGNLTDVEQDIVLPSEFVLYQNYPNPFNPATKIRYNIPFIETHSGASAQKVLLKVYDVLGSEIATLVNEEKFPGVYEVEFNGSRLSSGVYFYRLTASNSGGRYTATKKFVLMK